MDLTSISTIKKLSRKYGIRPSRRLGQNFLISRVFLKKILEAAWLKKSDLVLEIGPGFGVLTYELAKKVKKVMAIEIDRRLVEALKKITQEYKNIEIIQEDIIKLITNYQLLITKNYKLISNLPYQITSSVLRKFLEIKNKPSLMVVTVQKEVAERICAKPPKMSLLAVSIQFYGQPKIVSYLPRENFWPEPEVDSAILRIRRINVDQQAGFMRIKEKKFFRIVKAGFSHKRKMLKNNLAKGLKMPVDQVTKVLEETGLNKKIRAQELSLEDWVKIFKKFDKKILS